MSLPQGLCTGYPLSRDALPPYMDLVGNFLSFESWLKYHLSGLGLTLLTIGSLAETVLSSSPGTASDWLWDPEQVSGPWLPHL